ncbi:MAG: membrane dipeptidase [Alphaproteobacteria bacterium]|jgi:membrane dipeptidase
MSDGTDTDHARALHDEALVWDSHAGFEPEPDADLGQLERWRASGVNFLSINVSYDRRPWQSAYRALSAYRTWLFAHGDDYALISTIDELSAAKADGKLACAFDIEGMTALDGDAGMVEVFYRLGVRQMLIAYNLNNAAGGGCHDDDSGLTAFGREVIAEMNRVGMVLDLSHTGARTTLDAMAASSAPVIFSHSNARKLCDHERNITDEQIVACAATGGMVGVTGIGLFLGPGGATVDNLMLHIDHMCDLIGPAQVGISLDYSFNTEGFDLDLGEAFWPARQYADKSNIGFMAPESYPQITEALLARGHSDGEVRGILGGNFLRIAGSLWSSL